MDMCKNITFPQLRFRVVIFCSLFFSTLQEEHSFLTGSQIVFLMVVDEIVLYKFASEFSVQSRTENCSHRKPLKTSYRPVRSERSSCKVFRFTTKMVRVPQNDIFFSAELIRKTHNIDK